jgi:hypothetical protein
MDEELPHERSNSFSPKFFYFWSHFEAFFFFTGKVSPKSLKIKISFCTGFHWQSFAKKIN